MTIIDTLTEYPISPYSFLIFQELDFKLYLSIRYLSVR